ncbi:MAG: diguanylate cyclase (GGDEF)-like protein [Clostridium sp.]|jgi:diguanylate cyclase (GGDEF)-like protein
MSKLFPNRKKTIGVLINSFDGFYQSPVCKGIRKVAFERNFDTLFFAGGALESTIRDEAKQNVIFDLVNTDKLDGLIICSGLLMNYIGLDKFVAFLERYRDIPMVSIGIDIKDIPSIVFDNRECMHFMVNHLIEQHNYSEIAFITGTHFNPEAIMRFEGYADALKEHNIPYDEELIVEGDFHELSAAKAIDELMVKRNKKPEVIVVANDEMAIEVFYRLKQMGIEVGKDIALTGFDNVYEVRALSPAFTTIEQPIFEMASKAAEFIDLISAGQHVPQCTYLKGKLIVRESCGCYSILKSKIPLIIKEGLSRDTLYESECAELKKHLKREAIQHFNFKRMYIGTRDIMRGFNSVPNLEELTKVIRDAMPWYEMKQCYLCVYDTPVNSSREMNFTLPSKAKLILGYNDGKLSEMQYIDTVDILPKQFIYGEKRNDLILYPLVTGEDYFGYIAFDMNAIDEFVYETFREQISNTLKIQMLFNERIKAEEQLNLAVIELEKRNGELKNSYVIDELTGIFNRRGFYMHGGNLYKSAAITGGKAIMCFGDIDGLKKINDTYGHREGDEAILTAALLIKESCGMDDIVARIGGDEFIIIAANKSTGNEINEISELINSNFDRYNSIARKPYKLAISLGFSVYSPEMRLTFEELIQYADKQLYKRKKRLDFLP